MDEIYFHENSDVHCNKGIQSQNLRIQVEFAPPLGFLDSWTFMNFWIWESKSQNYKTLAFLNFNIEFLDLKQTSKRALKEL